MNGNKLGVLAQILIHHFLQMGVFSFFAGKAKLKGGKILGKGNGRNGLEGALKGVASVFLSRIERYNRGGKRQNRLRGGQKPAPRPPRAGAVKRYAPMAAHLPASQSRSSSVRRGASCAKTRRW